MIVEGFAHAKVTLSLRVVGVRADGYHDLEALAVSTEVPRDHLVIRSRAVPGNVLRVDPAASAPVDATNLVLRALALIGEMATEPRPAEGLELTLTKQIPTGAGLGGGSSDAALALRLLGVGPNTLPGVAERLGADVPFCLHGGPAWMRGIGDIVEPIDGLAPIALVIATPPFGCSTPAVYQAWDALGGPAAQREIDPPAGWTQLVPAFTNDLEAAAIAVEPRLETFRGEIEALLDRPTWLCGSGSSYAAWFASMGDAETAALALRASATSCRLAIATGCLAPTADYLP